MIFVILIFERAMYFPAGSEPGEALWVHLEDVYCICEGL